MIANNLDIQSRFLNLNAPEVLENRKWKEKENLLLKISKFKTTHIKVCDLVLHKLKKELFFF